MTLQDLVPYLDDLESRIDDAVEDALLNDWTVFAEGRWSDPVFAPRRPQQSHPRLEWPAVSLNDTLHDPVLMLLHQLSLNSRILAAGKGELLALRTNYGTPILPSMYGAQLYVMPEAAQTLPSCYPLEGGLDGVLKRLESGDPEPTAGLARQVFETAELFLGVLEERPRLARHVSIYHPDLQGPMDVCELLAGGTLFAALVDRPDDVHAVLKSITRTYRLVMTRWLEIVPPKRAWSVHWHMLHRGMIMLRDDSATNVSPAMFEEFIKPYDQELLGAFEGGALHFCGKGDLFIPVAATMPHLYAVHMSQPHLNDVEAVCRHTVDKGIQLIGLRHDAGDRIRERAGQAPGRVHCWDGMPA